jgi:hypothetical protein
MNQKRSGWASVASVATIILARILLAVMRHSDFDNGDWVAYAAVAIVIVIIVYGATLLVKKRRAAKSEATPAMATNEIAPVKVEVTTKPVIERVVVPVEPYSKPIITQRTCVQCKTAIEADAQFCCECGTAA